MLPHSDDSHLQTRSHDLPQFTVAAQLVPEYEEVSLSTKLSCKKIIISYGPVHLALSLRRYNLTFIVSFVDNDYQFTFTFSSGMGKLVKIHRSMRAHQPVPI